MLGTDKNGILATTYTNDVNDIRLQIRDKNILQIIFHYTDKKYHILDIPL